jgi:hypothetical protein
MTISSYMQSLRTALSPATTPAERKAKQRETAKIKALYKSFEEFLQRIDVYLNLATLNPEIARYVTPMKQLAALPNDVSKTVQLALKLPSLKATPEAFKHLLTLFNKTLNLYVVVASFFSLKISRKAQLSNLSVTFLMHLLKLWTKLKDAKSDAKNQGVAAYNSLKALTALFLFFARVPCPKAIGVGFSLGDIAIDYCK